MFALLLLALLQLLQVSLPGPLAVLWGLPAGAPAQAAIELGLAMVGAVTVGPLLTGVLGCAIRRRRLRWRQALGALLSVDLLWVVRHDRCLPIAQRAVDDADLVSLLVELVRLQCLVWLGWGPLAAVLVTPVALLMHSRLATARRGRWTVSGSLSAVLGAATLPLPLAGHAVAAVVSSRRDPSRGRTQ